MRSFVYSSLMFAAFILIPIKEASGQNEKLSITSLNWLGGCWEANIAERNMVITEQWMKPAGGMMMGAGRTVRGGKVVDYEFLRIIEEADGVYYAAKPQANKDETRFKLVKATTSQIVFENPTHDFPQRILYTLVGEKLTARIEGTKDGKTRGIDFPYTRVKCD